MVYIHGRAGKHGANTTAYLAEKSPVAPVSCPAWLSSAPFRGTAPVEYIHHPAKLRGNSDKERQPSDACQKVLFSAHLFPGQFVDPRFQKSETDRVEVQQPATQARRRANKRASFCP